MILEYMSPEPIWGYFLRHLIYRKRRGISSCYSSHGLSYVLLLLLYGFCFVRISVSTESTIRNSEAVVMSEAMLNPQSMTDVAIKTPAIKNDDEGDEFYDDELGDEERFMLNNAANGTYIGGQCENKCVSSLHHVYCDSKSNTCVCEKKYPVVIGMTQCAKARKLGEQCLHDLVCQHYDQNALCVQVRHNALCQCRSDYHSVSYLKPTKRVFCTQDIAVLTSDLPTLLGVTTGIAVLAGLICMVLHLFSKYPRHRNFGNANLPPPIMYSTDTVHSARPSSRSSLHSSTSIGSYGPRRPSSAPTASSKGILVSTSRSGSRRPSLASVHSTSSSIKSYSHMRFEKELQQKELRQEMKLRLTRLQQQQHFLQNKPHIIISDPLLQGGSIPKIIPLTTPSPITPNSTDELLPSVDEGQEPLATIKIGSTQAYIGPCTSSGACLLD